MKNKKLFWKSLRSENALDTKWFKVKKEAVQLPTGKILEDFYVMEKEDLVAILAINKNNDIFLVKQYRHAVNEITVDLPGGDIEKGEEPIEAAKRELLEETGIKARHIEKLLTYYPDSGRTRCVKHIFLATNLKEDTKKLHLHKNENEDVQLIKISFTEVLKKIKNGELKEATLLIGISVYLHKYPVR